MDTQARLRSEDGKQLEHLAEGISSRYPSPVSPLVVLRKIQKDPVGTSIEADDFEMSIRAPPVLSVDDVCKILGIARTTLYEEINAARLPARKIGNRTVITGPDFIEYLQQLPMYVPHRDENESGNK